MIQLLLKLLSCEKHYIILLDGLDECADKEADLVTRAFQTLLRSKSHIFKNFWTGRDDFIMRVSHNFRPNYRLRMNLDNIGPEINKFNESALSEALESGRLRLGDETIIIRIQNALEAGAQDM